MNEIEKFLRKISLEERKKIEKLIDGIVSGNDGVKIVKIKNTDFYRARLGNFRVIFHKDAKAIIIDSIRFRDDNTYKNL